MKPDRCHLKVDLLLLSFVFFVFFLSGTLAQAATFSRLLDRGTDQNAMAFNSQGDLYFIGWEAGLERAVAGQLPNGTAETLMKMSDYGLIFEPSGRTVVDINGAGIGFDGQGRVIQFLEESYKNDQDPNNWVIRVRFVHYDPNVKKFEALELTAGENFQELGLGQGAKFEVDARAHRALQMLVTQVGGAETILFTLENVPVVFQAPVSGGPVTTFSRFENDGYPWCLTVMERLGKRSLVVSHSDGNIYLIDLGTGVQSQLVTKTKLLGFFGETNADWGVYFWDLDYESISDKIYVAALVEDHDPEIPRTLIAITPDGNTLEKVFDVNDLTTALTAPEPDIRTPENGSVVLQFDSVTVNPVAVSQRQASLFLGDYWSGLKMIRVDLSPAPLTTAEQMLNILNFYDESLAVGSIYGSWPNNPRLNDFYIGLLRNTINSTYTVLARGYDKLPDPAGSYWRNYLCRVSIPYLLWNTDGLGRDYIRGPSVSQLHAMIESVGQSLGCK